MSASDRKNLDDNNSSLVSLVSLIAGAKPGAAIDLKRKRYVLAASPLVIDKKALTLRNGTIVGKSGRAVVIAGKNTRLRLEKISIVREGKEPGDVLSCRAGSVVTLEGCVVRGGRAKKGSMSIGAGVCTDGDHVDLTIRDCEIVDNELVAVVVAKHSRLRASRNTLRKSLSAFYIGDDAHAELDANTCKDHKTGGIHFVDRSKGTARNNRVSGGQNAFYIGGTSTPRIERNACEATKLVGIWVGNRAKPVIIANQVKGTHKDGITVLGHANATLSGNRVQATKGSGISFGDQATGTVDRNVLTGNKEAGIYVGNRACPTVTRNQCHDNGWSGIVVANVARPRIEKNVARGNTVNGLWVGGTSHPTAIDNTFEKNQRCGIGISEKATGRYERNRMTANESHGVVIEDSAAPTLVKNVCHKNEQAGILVRDVARPTLEENLLTNNSDSGIEYWNRAAGAVTKNICRKNEDSGIRLIGDVSPALTSNQCTGNDGKGIALDEDVDDVRPTKAKLLNNTSRGNSEDDDDESGGGGGGGGGGGIGTRASWGVLTTKLGRKPIRKYARQVWRPITHILTKDDDGGSSIASKFGGRPYLEADAAWPCCGNCNQPMPLIVQLDLGRLPKAALEQCAPGSVGGLLQFFFCRNRKDACSDYGATSHLLRVVPKPTKKRKTKSVAANVPKKIEGSFPPKLIEGWRDHGEMIRWVELADATRLRLARKLAALGLTYFDGDDDVGSGPHVDPELGDKLLGWPCWIHEAPKMRCAIPKCKKAMRHMFQVDSEHNVPWMWGDSGTAWLFQCPTHHASLELEWQCH